jgi:hypothetical protein
MLRNLIWPPKIAAGAACEAYVERLSGLRAARADTLTQEEFDEMRAEVLSELASFPQMYGRARGILAVVCFGCVGFIIYGLVSHKHRFVQDPIIPLMVASLIWWRGSRDCAAKRALSIADRLNIVDELAKQNFITQDEASKLRIQIENLYANKHEA